MSDRRFKSDEDLADWLMKLLGWNEDEEGLNDKEMKVVMTAASLMRANMYERPSAFWGETSDAFQRIGVQRTFANSLASALDTSNKRQKVEDDGPRHTLVPFEIGNGKSKLPLGDVAKTFGGVHDREKSIQETRDGLKKLARLRFKAGLDKKNVSLLGVAATSESGKTEFLRYIFNNFCSYVRDKSEDSIADQVLDDINSASPVGADKFDKVVVLFATFNQKSPYSKSQENRVIIKTTVERLLRSYNGNIKMSSDGRDSWKEGQRFNRSSLDGICDLFPKNTAFIFCIDEVSKVKAEGLEDYQDLMNQLLAFSQTELEEGRFVAIVATSLSVFDLGESVLEQSGRSLWPIRFPTRKPKLEEQARKWIKVNTNVGKDKFYLDVTMNVLQSESSIQVWKEITQISKIETRVKPFNKVYSTHDHVSADEIFLLAARGVLERPYYESLKSIKEKAITVADSLHGIIDLQQQQQQVDGNVVTDWDNAMGAVLLPAWRILQLPFPQKGKLFQAVENWVISETHKLFFTYGPEETVKKWELATMAALEIRKAMFQVVAGGVTPSLRQVYEGLGVHHNLSDDVLKKKALTTAAVEEFCELPTATDAKDKKKGHPCFYYYSKLENEPGVVEGVFHGGFSSLSIFFQMKLYSPLTTPLQIKDWLVSASKRAKALGYSDKKFLVQLFVCGEIDATVEDYMTEWPSNSMVLGTVAMRNLFQPFGSGLIQDILDQKKQE
ncbi:hypothetical protein IV203_018685 [Nitzschia inconspicua]|uniref:Uncharacterized protein n=1 Tax=Nitzschia inconspicua TaxID=303405 RepID=A0A9K3M255_9STRA|nr:hypothetical protein IV203_018685 [Nitzschia inconspicua]